MSDRVLEDAAAALDGLRTYMDAAPAPASADDRILWVTAARLASHLAAVLRRVSSLTG